MDQKDEFSRVWVEYIPLTLKQIPATDIHSAINMLIEAAEGFKWIVRLYGCVEVDEENIGINNKGKVKVWLSGFFQYNHPHSDKN